MASVGSDCGMVSTASNTSSKVANVLAGDRDQLTVARIAAVTRRYAQATLLTGEEEAAALADLAEVANGRMDLLARQAGLAIGLHEHDGDAPVHLQIAQLCIQAGADIALIPGWIEEGRRRHHTATKPLPAD
jgi:hypothetical protein